MIGNRGTGVLCSAHPMREYRIAACFVLLVALALQCFGLRAELVFHGTGPADSQSTAKNYRNPSDVAYPLLSGKGAEEVRVVLSGDITHTDVASLKVMAGLLKSGKQKLAGNSVWLASNGGDFEASMRVGRLLRELGVYTVVGKSDQCMSACVFAFMGGERRLVEGRLGVHRPYFPVAEDFPDRQIRFRNLQKILRGYIEEMDFPDSLYEAVMAVPPESMKILAREELKRFYLEGISPSSEDLADASAARRLGLSMHEYLQVKAKSIASGRPLHLTECSGASCFSSPSTSSCAGAQPASARSGNVACGAAVEAAR